MKISIEIIVNGEEHHLYVKPNQTLIDVLREDLTLTGTKKGCGSGKCGSCTVLMDGRPVSSCLILAPQAEGKEIVTIEGVSDGHQLHPVQAAFVEHGAVQCGYCTPGMVLSSIALLAQNPDPTPREVQTYLSGNLCRCTGYQKIIEAVQDAASQMSQGGDHE